MQQIEAQKREQMQQSYLEQQRHILPDIIPEWRDSKVAATEATQIRDFLLGEGFSEQEIWLIKKSKSPKSRTYYWNQNKALVS